jgi:hypothetical protein
MPKYVATSHTVVKTGSTASAAIRDSPKATMKMAEINGTKGVWTGLACIQAWIRLLGSPCTIERYRTHATVRS